MKWRFCETSWNHLYFETASERFELWLAIFGRPANACLQPSFKGINVDNSTPWHAWWPFARIMLDHPDNFGAWIVHMFIHFWGLSEGLRDNESFQATWKKMIHQDVEPTFFILARTNHRTPTTRCAFNRCFNGASSTKTVSKSSGQPTSDPTTRVGLFLTSFLTGWWSSNVIWLDGKYSVCLMYHDTYEGNNSKVDSSDCNLVSGNKHNCNDENHQFANRILYMYNVYFDAPLSFKVHAICKTWW